MLIINDRQFAASDKEFDQYECVGFWRAHEGGVLLMDSDRQVKAFIVKESAGRSYFVDARDADGGIWFSQSASSITERWLGIDGASPNAESAIAVAVLAQAGTTSRKTSTLSM